MLKARSFATRIWTRLRTQIKGLSSERYHPERHYMRGAGPASQGKPVPDAGRDAPGRDSRA